MHYHQDGRFANCDADYSISVKRIISQPNHKTCGEMTSEERGAIPQNFRDDPHNQLQIPFGKMSDVGKGALLLAHHEGKYIEMFYGKAGWMTVSPSWDENASYRVYHEPVRKVFELHWKQDGWNTKDTHRITFETVDGVPDTDTIKMEEL